MNLTFENVSYLYVCKNKLFAVVDEDFFKNKFVNALYKVTKKFYNEFNEIPFNLKNPSLDQIKIIIEDDQSNIIIDKELSKEENIRLFLINAKQILETDLSQFSEDYMKKAIPAWIAWQNHQKGHKLALEWERKQEITPDNVFDIIKKSREIFNRRSSISIDTDLGKSILDPDAHRQIPPSELYNTGFPLFNTWVSGNPNGGLTPGEFTLLVGESNIGKCVCYDTHITIRHTLSKKIEKIYIGKFFNYLTTYSLVKENVKGKFLQTIEPENYEVLTSNDRWVKIKAIGKTIEYNVYILNTSLGKVLKCADEHLIFTPNGLKPVSDLISGNEIITKDGIETITIYQTDIFENMFDLQIDSEDHSYYTNDILSHNSIWLGQFAKNLWMNGCNVALASVEMSVEKLYKRIGANAFNIPINEYVNLSNDTVRMSEIIKRHIEKYSSSTMDFVDGFSPIGELWTKRFSVATPESVTNWVLNLEQYLGKKIHVLVIDYLTEMANNHGFLAFENSYQHHKVNVNDLYAAGIEHKWATLTAHQIKIDGYGADDLTLRHLGESSGIIHRLDSVIGIIQTPQMKLNKKYYLKNMKGRDSEYKNYYIEYHIDYNYMSITEQNKMLEPESFLVP
jgi:KaiC/GvpD/RAD55 family RecA-like ATPase